MRTIRIGIVDDHSLFCDGIESILNTQENMRVTLKALSGNEVIKKLSLEKKKQFPDILLLDIEMPEMNGLEVLQKLKKLYPTLKIIIVSFHDEPYYVFQLLEMGANSYLRKDHDTKVMIETIRSVFTMGKYLPEDIMKLLYEFYPMLDSEKKTAKKSEACELTKSELKILQLICSEMTTLQIADFCGISSRTVESHKYAIFRKTGVENSLGLINYSIQNGLYVPKKK